MAQLTEGKLKELKTAELRHEPGARRDLVVTLNRRSAPRSSRTATTSCTKSCPPARE